MLINMSCQSGAPKNGPTGSQGLTVAAASNLTDALAEIGPQFTSKTGIRWSSASALRRPRKANRKRGSLRCVAAADTEYIEQLERQGLLTPGTRALYARGRLVMWLPPGSNLKVERNSRHNSEGV